MRRHLRSQETQREAARAFLAPSGGVDRHRRLPVKNMFSACSLLVPIHRNMFYAHGGEGAPRAPLQVRFGALWVIPTAARARDESSPLAAQAERTTTIQAAIVGFPGSPGQGLLGKPSPERREELLARWRAWRSAGIWGSAGLMRESGLMMGGPFLQASNCLPENRKLFFVSEN